MRILSVFLALVLLLGAVTVPVGANDALVSVFVTLTGDGLMEDFSPEDLCTPAGQEALTEVQAVLDALSAETARRFGAEELGRSWYLSRALVLRLPAHRMDDLSAMAGIALVERLNEAGYLIDYAKVKGRNPNGNANRAHVAAELLEQGYVTSIREAFDTILSDNGGFYVPPSRLPLIDVIKELRRIGVLPVLAHPLQELTELELRELLPHAIEAGVVGLETMHSSYAPETICLAEKITSEFKLLSSGGSDFHGSVKPDISLGMGKGWLCIPSEIYTNLLNIWK